MEIFIIDESDAARRSIKNSRCLSEISNIDPLYIFDMRESPGNWLEDMEKLGSDAIEVEFTRLENDWIPGRIRKMVFEDFIRKLKDDERKFLSEYYDLEESDRYYLLKAIYQKKEENLFHKIGIKKPDEGRRKLFDIFKRNNFDFYGAFYKGISRDAGMFYCSQPMNTGDIKEHIKRVRRHYREMKKYDLLNIYSPFYAGLLNRMDYGVSLVNKDRIILYANWRRRRFHGDDILGRKCYKVFPVDSPNEKCQNCPMDKVIEGAPEHANKYRCEVHKLKKLHYPQEVYFVSETTSLYEISEAGGNKIERWGINVVRDNTIWIITQEFQKVLQRVHGIQHIVHLLKFALLGGTVEDFRSKFGKLFEKDKNFFDAIVEKISYLDTGTQKKKILNFGFGRFRYYLNTIDIFSNKNSPGELKTDWNILQIYDAYDVNGRMEKFIGKSIEYDEGGKVLINKLEFDFAGQLVNKKLVRLSEIKNHPDAIKYAEQIGHYQKDGDSENLGEWYDIELLRGNELIGYVSVDWLERIDPNKALKYEILLGLRDFMFFLNQSILWISDHRHLQLTDDLKNIISKEHQSEDDLYFAFSEKLCESFQALKCEIYLFKGKEQVERKYLYYKGLNKKSAEEANKILPRNYRIGQHLIGNVLEIILKYIAAHPEGGGEIYKRCVNVLNYEKYDEFYKNDPERQVNKEYKEQEEALICKPGFFGKPIKLINCLIAPIIYKGEPVGAVKITNNLTEGKLYFPINDQRVLDDVAGQLAIKNHNIKLYNREKKISDIFTQLAYILRRSYGDIRDIDINEEISRKIIHNLKDIVNADHVLYYLVEKDENFKPYLVRKVWELGGGEEPPGKIDKSQASNDELGKLFFDLVERIAPDNAGEMKTFFENSGYKKILRRIDQGNQPYSILLLGISEKFDKADLEVIDTITGLIEAVLTIRALKKQSMEIMDNIAHQIISPLKGLETHCNNLIEDMLPISDKNFFRYENDEKKLYVLNLLRSQTFHVRFIAGNYRQYMNFASGKKPDLDLKPINLAHLISQIAGNYQPIAKSQGLTNINVSPENKAFYMEGDELMLLHIFGCLTDNAIKYSDKGKPINIELSEMADRYDVRVINWGIPIESKYWKKIFEREFRTPEAITRFSQGSGLGLYIVHQICRSIRAECCLEKSDMKTGETVFKVKLPKSIPGKKK